MSSAWTAAGANRRLLCATSPTATCAPCLPGQSERRSQTHGRPARTAFGGRGDLMHRSETLRMLGPLRYQVAGALTLLQGRAYSVRATYVPAPSLRCALAGRPATCGCAAVLDRAAYSRAQMAWQPPLPPAACAADLPTHAGMRQPLCPARWAAWCAPTMSSTWAASASCSPQAMSAVLRMVKSLQSLR